jgi:hypothetical protein
METTHEKDLMKLFSAAAVALFVATEKPCRQPGAAPVREARP